MAEDEAHGHWEGSEGTVGETEEGACAEKFGRERGEMGGGRAEIIPTGDDT